MHLVHQWLSRHSNPMVWVGGTSNLHLGGVSRGGLDLDLVGLGWARGRPRSTKVTRHPLHCTAGIFQAWSTPTMPVARQPAWSSGVLQHHKAPSCLRRPQWKVRRSGGTRR